jgi:hypothetical protein
MVRRDTVSLSPGSGIWARGQCGQWERCAERTELKGIWSLVLVSAQSSVENYIKQTIALFIYILQQITSCVGTYILQVLLLWQKHINWTLTLLLRFIRHVSSSVCKLQYLKRCTHHLSEKPFGYCTASYTPFPSKIHFTKMQRIGSHKTSIDPPFCCMERFYRQIPKRVLLQHSAENFRVHVPENMQITRVSLEIM